MIKRLITVVLLSALAAIHAAGQAQPNRFPPINLVAGDPTGTACPAHSMVQSSDSGILYTCQGGAYHTAGGQTIPVTAVTWPPSCTTGTYVPATNTCVPTGTAANPGGSPGQTQINAGGSTFIGIPGSLTDTTYGWKTQGGTQYAAGWQTGAGNNGIANASAPNATIIADPSYGNTEYFSTNPTFRPFAMGTIATHLIDHRNGQQADTYRDPAKSLFDNTHSGQTINFNQYLTPGSDLGRPRPLNIWANMLAPGISLGSATVGPQNWTVGQGITVNQISASPGIHEGIAVTHVKTGIGDNVGGYFYNTNYGGSTASADEGNHGIAWHGEEANTTFKGTVATGGGGSAATIVKITCTTDCGPNLPYNAGPGNGRYLVDQTTIDSGNVTAATNPSGGTPGEFTLDHSITPSNAISTLVGTCNGGAAPVPVGTGYNTVTCTVTSSTGFLADNTTPVCFNGQFHEQTTISNIAGNVLTMKLRHAHAAGFTIAQGGPCGTFVNFPSNDSTLTNTTLHFPVDIIGARDATHMYYAFFYTGTAGQANLGSPVGGLGSVLPSTLAATNVTNVGGTVDITVGGFSNNSQFMVGGPLYISNASGGLSGYNGPCLNSKYYFGQTHHLTCTQPASNGLGVAATATVTAGNSPWGNTAYVTWAGAEVLDVLDHSVNPPVTLNAGVTTFTLEPNKGAWANGDAVEEAHHYATRIGALGTHNIYNKMNGSSSALALIMAGDGICCGGFAIGGNLANSNMVISAINNNTAANVYRYHGGYQVPPGGIGLKGPYNFGLVMDTAPDPNGTAIVYAGCPLSGCADVNYSYYPFVMAGNGGGFAGILYRPGAGELTTVGNWVWGSEFGAQTFRGNATFGPVVAPTLAAPTVRTTGGALPDATDYYYTVYVQTPTGALSVQGNEQHITTGTSGGTNSVSLSWTKAANAASYWVCRGTAPGGGLRGPNLIGSANAAYTDIGIATYSGGCPTTDTTTRGGPDQAAFVGLNSSGTAFELKLQAPASMAANATITVTKISTVSITPAAVTASTCAEQTFNTYTGLATTQVVNVSPPAFLGAHVWIASARVSAANTLAIAFCADATGGTPPAGVYLAVAF